MGGVAVGKADQADMTEVLRLQGVLRERHAELDGLDDDDGRTAVMKRVFDATDALVNFEGRLPLLRDERRRNVSSVIVCVAAGAAAVAMLSEVALVVAGRVSWWCLFAVAPTLALAGAIG